MNENILAVSDDNFHNEVILSTKPTLVDFWAEWCAPCRALNQHIREISVELGKQINVRKLNTDKNNLTTEMFAIRSIPTVILFKNGKPVDRLVGAVAKSKLIEMINKHA